jgi:hypothetical protein
VPAVPQPLDQLDHGVDVLGRPGVVLGRFNPQRAQIVEEGRRELRGELRDRHPPRMRLGDDLVVHVGEVHDLRHRVATALEHAPQLVLEEERPEVADMGVIVDGRAAGIHPHPAFLQRLEGNRPSPQRVVEKEPAHDSSSTAISAGLMT